MAKAASQRIVNLDRVCQNNIVVEDFQLEDDSVFRQEYVQAASIIDGILQFNKKKESFGTKAEYQTAVPFIGERGTGKTSAMYSVLHMLKTNPEAFLASSKGKDKVSFICMDMIDINSMKPNENLMEIVLAQMLTCMQEQEKKPQRQEGFTPDRWHSLQREIYTQIDALSRAFSRLHWRKKFDPEEQGIVGIQKIAETKNAIQSFQKLVFDFIKAFQTLQRDQTACYLVLALDDIDMYRGSNQDEKSSQFAILEQIYDYLRIPNVIVLLTFNEQILKRNCMSYYCNAYFKRSFTQECTPDEQKEIAVLTKQFLSKLFPQEQRVYMPNFLFVNTNNAPNLYIVPRKNGETKPFPPFTDNGDFEPNAKGVPDPKAIAVKEFMLRLIAYKTGVYFDINGTKKHFLEPRNLRELGAMLQVIFRWLDPMESNDPERVKIQNREMFLNYIRNQFAGEHLCPEEYQHFQNLSALPLVRQSRSLVDDTCRYRMLSVKNPEEFGYLGSTNRDRWKYSYGELTHNIYFATRVHNHGTTLYSKAFIHCILGSQSIILNQMLYEDDRMHILEFVGSSIGGRWSNEMLPKFRVSKGFGNPAYAAGSCSAPVAVFLNLCLPDDLQKMLLPEPGGISEQGETSEQGEASEQSETSEQGKTSKQGETSEQGETSKQGEISEENQNKIQHFAEALAIIGMFFTGYPAVGLTAKLDVDIENFSGKSDQVFYLKSSSEDHICFNALNPFLNLYALTDIGDCGSQRDYLSYIFVKLFSLTFPQNLMVNLEEKKADGASAETELEELKKSRMVDPETQNKCNMRISSGKQAAKLLAKIQEDKLESFGKAWQDKLNQLGNKSTSTEGTQTSVAFTQASPVFAPENQNMEITLPVQHFDMMYNILKRVSTVSYHDIPEEADASEAYDCFVRLYENIGQELDEQDKQYGSNSPGLAKRYRKSFFYQIFTDKQESDRNPYLKELFNAVIQNMLQYTNARRKMRIQSND